MKSEKIFDFTFFIQIKTKRRLSFCSMKAHGAKVKKKKAEESSKVESSAGIFEKKSEFI